MPAPVLGALQKFIQTTLEMQTWPEEVPRWDLSGNAINPEASRSPATWPAITVALAGKVPRANTFEDSYSEEPPIIVTAWGTTREQVDGAMGQIETALVQAANWAYQNSPIGQAFAALGYPQYWLYDIEVGQWNSQQHQLERLADNQLCWTADMDLYVKMHGSISTT